MRRRNIGHIILLAILLFIGFESASAKNNRIKVGKVTFEGNHAYPDKRLQGLMLTRPSRFLAAASYFYPEIFRDDIDNLITFYKQNGYLEAHITDTSVTHDSLQDRIKIHIALEEGDLTYIEGITFFGNNHFTDSLLRQQTGLRVNGPLRRPVIEDAVMTLLSLYGENGFLDASVVPNVQINNDAKRAIVDFVVQERTQSKIENIAISGLKKTKKYVITRELNFRRGEVIKFSRLIESQRNLYLIGLFESVFVRPTPPASGDSTAKDILIEVKEKKTSEFGITLGYGSVEKIRGRIELSTDNLAGTARKSGVAVEANLIKQGVSFSFSEPRTFGTKWTTDLNIYGEYRQEPGYHIRAYGSRLTIGRELKQSTSISAFYRFENSDLTRIDLLTEVDELKPRIRSLNLSIIHDSRDNLFDPHQGTYISWHNELAGGFLHGSNSFARSVVTLKQFKPMGSQATLGTAIEVGWMDAFGEELDIPLSERFYTGGPVSLRGFGYQMVGPLDINGEPLGGKFKIVWNVIEVRRALYKILGMVAFIEAGNVWPEVRAFKFKDIRADIGTGLRLNSPIGIARVDFALNADKHNGEPQYKIFLGIGHAF